MKNKGIHVFVKAAALGVNRGVICLFFFPFLAGCIKAKTLKKLGLGAGLNYSSGETAEMLLYDILTVNDRNQIIGATVKYR